MLDESIIRLYHGTANPEFLPVFNHGSAIKRDNLAEAMSFAKLVLNKDAASFFTDFKRSGMDKGFEAGAAYACDGCTGPELARKTYDRLGTVLQRKDYPTPTGLNNTTEYWIGYAIGYYQGRSGKTFEQIFSKIPINNWYRLYPTLHEVSDETLYEKLMRMTDTNSPEFP